MGPCSWLTGRLVWSFRDPTPDLLADFDRRIRAEREQQEFRKQNLQTSLL